MKVLRGDHRNWPQSAERRAVAVGVFDGVHVGHRAIIDTVARHAEAVGADDVTVLTFDRHPLEVVASDRAPRLLCTLDQRLELFEALGVGTAAVLTFDDQLRDLEPAAFAGEILVDALGTALVAVGADFRFGRGRSGDVDMLRRLGLEHGYLVEEVALVGDGAPISSTTIREWLAGGDVVAAARGLGRPFELRGRVVAGDGRGAGIGFPTANLEVDGRLAVPGRGVYAAWAVIGDTAHRGAVNVGVRPTFGGEREVVEVHVIDFEGDLYGMEMAVRFVARLRDEQAFTGIEQLIDQIRLDVVAARAALPAPAG